MVPLFLRISSNTTSPTKYFQMSTMVNSPLKTPYSLDVSVISTSLSLRLCSVSWTSPEPDFKPRGSSLIVSQWVNHENPPPACGNWCLECLIFSLRILLNQVILFQTFHCATPLLPLWALTFAVASRLAQRLVLWPSSCPFAVEGNTALRTRFWGSAPASESGTRRHVLQLFPLGCKKSSFHAGRVLAWALLGSIS